MRSAGSITARRKARNSITTTLFAVTRPTTGKMVEITDEEFESVAPEMSRDIELRSFVPLEQIPPLYFQKPYFLAPAGNPPRPITCWRRPWSAPVASAIGSFVMRGHEYLVAIFPTMASCAPTRCATPMKFALPRPLDCRSEQSRNAAKVKQFTKAIEELTRKELDVSELEDEEAEALQALVKPRQKDRRRCDSSDRARGGRPGSPAGANVIDLMEVLRKSCRHALS